MSSFLEQYKSRTPSAKKSEGIPGFEMNAPIANNGTEGDIGIEFEIEGRNLPRDGRFAGVRGEKSGCRWTSKADGSLRGEGREYVLSNPCYVDELEPVVTNFFEKFLTRETEIINTNRCSTHIHINVNGFKLNELTSAIALWSAFEKQLIRWCGIQRVNNHFCLSSEDSDTVVEGWSVFLEHGQSVLNRNAKYHALNILTLWTFGSLEFRCMAGADEPTRPIMWAKFLYNLVQYAKRNFSNPEQIAFAISEQGGREIFHEICEQAGLLDSAFYTEVLEGSDDFDMETLDGFRLVQNLCCAYPWAEWQELIDRQYIPNPFKMKLAKKKAPRLRGLRGLEPAPGVRMHRLDDE